MPRRWNSARSGAAEPSQLTQIYLELVITEFSHGYRIDIMVGARRYSRHLGRRPARCNLAYGASVPTAAR